MFKILPDLRIGAAVGRRDHVRVIQLCEAAIGRNPSDTLSMALLANAREHLGDHEAAFEIRRRVVELDPLDVNTLRRLAADYARRGEYRVACEAVRRALAADRPRRAPGRFERWFFRLTGIQAWVVESSNRSRRYDKEWRRWAANFLAMHGEAEHYEAPIN